MGKTKNKIILNTYEKRKLEKKKFECPICNKKLNLDNFIIIFEQNGINLEYYYNDAIERFKNICHKKCLICLKKIYKMEENNKIKSFLNFNVKTYKENKFINDEEKLEAGMDYCEDYHSICLNCYKLLNKNKRGIKKEEIIYKKIFCNICNIDHYIDMKEWKNFKSKNNCCNCVVF